MGYDPRRRQKRLRVSGTLGPRHCPMQPVPRDLELGWNPQIPHSAKSEHPAYLLLKTGIPRQQAELEAIVLSSLFGRQYARKYEALTHFVFLRTLELHCAPKSNTNRPVGELKRSVSGNSEGAETPLAQTADRVGSETQNFTIE